MSYNRIIFWKWDDPDFHDEAYLRKIDDIARRSVFDTLLVALTWCRPSLYEPEGRAAIAAACERAHSHGMKLLFDIDVRPARQEFFRRYPSRKLGMAQPIMLRLDEKGRASGETSTGESGDHYGVYNPVGMRLLRAYAYKSADGGYDPQSLAEVTDHCAIERLEPGHARASLDCGPGFAGMDAVVFAVFEYDYPDIFSDEMLAFHAELLGSYAGVPLDGATTDEWGAFPYPGFDFTGAWRRPWYSDSLAQIYLKSTGRDLVLDFLNTRVAPAGDPSAQLAAINDYYRLLRERNVEIESRFYESVKRIWGQDAFVGVHPTWFAIEETANTPEIWKNGLDWWDVPRDFGQTDEIMIYPVRLALAHKCGGAVFYNMWYNMGCPEVSRFWLEAWENLRYGGRTHTLGYECRAEAPGVFELSGPDLLESVSEIEELVGLANLFQRTATKSNVAVVMGYPAAVNWTVNVEDGVQWDIRKGVFPEAFAVARDIFQAGWVCDLVPSYEIDDGDLRFEDGKVRYGTETYDALVFVRPEFSTRETLCLMASLASQGFPLAVLGECTADSLGNDVRAEFARLASAAGVHTPGADSGPVLEALGGWGISANDVPNGSRLQDGSVIICNSGAVHRGNLLRVEGVIVNGHVVDALCDDAFGIAIRDDGTIDRFFGGRVREIRIDGGVAFSSDSPSDLYRERTESGCRTARVDGRSITWE